jgi:hypothetical protein
MFEEEPERDRDDNDAGEPSNPGHSPPARAAQAETPCGH